MRTLIWPSGSDGSARAGSSSDCEAFAGRRPRSTWRAGLVVPGQLTTKRRRIVGARPFTWNFTVGAWPGVRTAGLMLKAWSCGRAATLDGWRLGLALGFGFGFGDGLGAVTGSP